jgi:hypothetical protein
MTENRLNDEKPEFGNLRHIQAVRNEEKDAELCMRCAEKQIIIRNLKQQITEMETAIKVLSSNYRR